MYFLIALKQIEWLKKVWTIWRIGIGYDLSCQSHVKRHLTLRTRTFDSQRCSFQGWKMLLKIPFFYYNQSWMIYTNANWRNASFRYDVSHIFKFGRFSLLQMTGCHLMIPPLFPLKPQWSGIMDIPCIELKSYETLPLAAAAGSISLLLRLSYKRQWLQFIKITVLPT